MTDVEIIEAIIEREGGYVDHPADKGGPTKYGITIGTLGQWRGHPVSDDDVKALFIEEARLIYGQRYLKAPGFDQIVDSKLRAFIVDAGVNHGPTAATKMLQRAVGAKVDGVMGPDTLLKLGHADAQRIYLEACAERVVFYGGIVTRNPEQAVFALGWANRVAQFIREA